VKTIDRREKEEYHLSAYLHTDAWQKPSLNIPHIHGTLSSGLKTPWIITFDPWGVRA
jgi:hypothetical protein